MRHSRNCRIVECVGAAVIKLRLFGVLDFALDWENLALRGEHQDIGAVVHKFIVRVADRVRSVLKCVTAHESASCIAKCGVRGDSRRHASANRSALTPFARFRNRMIFRSPLRGTDRQAQPEEVLDSIFAWREPRKVASNLTLQDERKLYLLADSPNNRRYAAKYLDVYQLPNDKIEIRAAEVKIPY